MRWDVGYERLVGKVWKGAVLVHLSFIQEFYGRGWVKPLDALVIMISQGLDLCRRTTVQEIYSWINADARL
jgi:hypothetical protein